jgi:hypothetical protein
MAYIKTEWENSPSTKTPINANNLNKIENGIYTNSVNIGELTDLNTTNKNSTVEAINENNSHIGDLSSLTTTNKTSTTEAINETYNKINKVNLAKSDGLDNAILIAETTFNRLHHRQVLIFATTETGYTDATESGIYNVGLSSRYSLDEHVVSYNVTGNASTDRIYTVSDGANLKVYLKKTVEYRTLYATLLGKSDEISWKLN